MKRVFLYIIMLGVLLVMVLALLNSTSSSAQTRLPLSPVTLGNAHGIPVVTPVAGKPVGMTETAGERRWWEDPDRLNREFDALGAA
jgi:hypothetical protein